MKPSLQQTGIQRLQRLNALLEEGLSLPESERASWLSRLQETDPELQSRLRALLNRSEVETDDFLRDSVEGVVPIEAEAEGDRPGDEVGPYRLICKLGQGGMAAVWLAERSDGQPRRQVALKLPVHAWGASASLVRRMAQERNILAALEHPRIARLYEAGVTAAGRPWLAMERVEGQPLDQWCRENRPDVNALLRLFLQIADAVCHAHAHLVVHRDLKPANVLVDSHGEVHLLDFGVAKLMDETVEAADAQMTRQIGRAVTPDYGAPEQMGNRPITMACDVYSLGVMLYEMLAGERPYRLDYASYEDLEAAVLAAPTPPASMTAMSRMPAVARALRGDLDAILAKALQKDPRDRYVSVESMAADVRRHLDGRPVLARRPSWTYLCGKLMRRHGAAVMTTASVFVALGVGLAAALYQWNVASRERDYTERLLTRSLAVQQLSTRVLTEGVERGEQVSLDELLKRTQAFLQGDGDPIERAAGASTLASWYNSYGNYTEADAVLSRAIAQLDAHTEPELTQMMRCQQGHAWSGLGRFADAEKRLLEVARDPLTEPASASYCYRILAIRTRNDNKGKEALAYAQLAQQRLDSARGARPLDQALIIAEQAYAQGLLSRPDLADGLFAQAIEQFSKLGRGESHSAISLHNNRAIAWLNAGRPREAWPHLEKAAAIARRRSPKQTLPSYLIYNRVNALRSMGRSEAALNELEPLRSATLKGEVSAAESMGVWLYDFFLHSMHGKQADALQAFDRMAQVTEKIKFNPTSSMAAAWVYSQAKRHLMLGRPREAQQVLDGWLSTVRRAGSSDSTIARGLIARAEALSAQGHPDQALHDLLDARTAADQVNLSEQPMTLIGGQVRLELGKTYSAAGRPAQAREALMQAVRHLEDSVGPEHFQTVEAVKALQELR